MNKEVTCPDPRVGKFLIMHAVLEDGANRPWLQALFSLCVPLEINDHESGRGKEYCCISEKLFQPLVEGEEIPFYRLECDLARPFTAEENQKAVRIGGFKFYAVRQIIVRVPPARIGTRPLQTQVH